MTSLPNEKIQNLSGVYFGWASIQPKDPAHWHSDLHPPWHHAIITISHYHPDKSASIATKKTARVHILHSYRGTTFFSSNISIILLGDLRPSLSIPIQSSNDKESILTSIIHDIQITRNSLSREEWAADCAIQQLQRGRSERSFSDRYVDARMSLQGRVNSLSIHKLGVRNENKGINDRGIYGIGGVFVVRDGVSNTSF